MSVNTVTLPLVNLPYTILYFGNFPFFDRYLLQPKKKGSWTTTAWFQALVVVLTNLIVGYIVLPFLAPLTVSMR